MTFKKVFRGYDPEQVDKYIAETALKEQQLRAAQKERIDELSDENYALRQQVKQYQMDEQAISKSLIASQQLAQELKFDAERFSDLVLSRAKIFYATWRAYAKTLVASLSDEEVRQFNELQRKIENVINVYSGGDIAKETEAQTEAQTAAANASQPEQPQQRPQPQPEPMQEQERQPEPQSEPQQTPMQEHQTEQTYQPEQAPRQDVFAEFERVPTPEVAPRADEETWRQARAVVDVTPSEQTMAMGRYSNPITRVEQAAQQVIDLRELTRTDLSLEDICAELGLIDKKPSDR